MLYARELHEPLTMTPWSEARARDAVQALVADAERAYSPAALWPAQGWDRDLVRVNLANDVDDPMWGVPGTLLVGRAMHARICHGTSGNGYALLKTFEGTGDERWLGRARAFAMHALEQTQRLPARYSLFTGSIGAALFAADCVDGRARYPVLDSLEPE